MSVWRRAVGDGPVSQALSKPNVQHKPTSVTLRGMENNVDKRKAAGIDIDVTIDDDLGLEDDKGGNSDDTDDEQPAVRVYSSIGIRSKTIVPFYLAIWCERGCEVPGAGWHATKGIIFSPPTT